MSSGKKSNFDSEEEFLERVLRYQEKSLTPLELRELNEELRDNPQRLAEFTRLCETSRLIHEASVLPAGEGPARQKRVERFALRLLPSRLLWVEHAGLAALLLVCVGLGVLLFQGSGVDEDLGDSVARLEVVSQDVVFSKEHAMPRHAGSLLEKGWMQLDRGVVRIVFHSGATVELAGPAALGIDTPMRAYLEYGKASVHAPESARDFVVATEGMEVVDLGTRFEINVERDSRVSKVSVTEGLVDLHLGNPGMERRIQPLEAGWKAQVDATGEIVKLEEPPETSLVPQTDIHPHLLAHWKFDEIGPDGMLTDSGKRQMSGIFRAGSEGGSCPGVIGQALDFGADGYVDLTEHLPLLGGLDAFTISAWIRDPGKPIAIIFALSDGTVENRVQFNLNQRNLAYVWENQSSHWDSVAGRIDGWEPGRWYHVAVSLSDHRVKLYRDGQLIGSGSVGVQIGTRPPSPSEVSNASQACFGYLNQGRSRDLVHPQRFAGQMDDAQIYGRALDAEAIRLLYEHPGETSQSREVRAQGGFEKR